MMFLRPLKEECFRVRGNEEGETRFSADQPDSLVLGLVHGSFGHPSQPALACLSASSANDNRTTAVFTGLPEKIMAGIYILLYWQLPDLFSVNATFNENPGVGA